MIMHTVAFKTKHPKGSIEEKQFLKAGIDLGKLPMVNNFQCFQQVGKKNGYDFGFSMEFESQHDFDAYNLHPNHVEFVKTRWDVEVETYIEIDYIKYVE